MYSFMKLLLKHSVQEVIFSLKVSHFRLLNPQNFWGLTPPPSWTPTCAPLRTSPKPFAENGMYHCMVSLDSGRGI